MKKRKVDSEKLKKVLEKRGYKDGKPAKGYEAHHIIPLAEGGKDVPRNIRVIKKEKHRQIHKNRRKRGEI